MQDITTLIPGEQLVGLHPWAIDRVSALVYSDGPFTVDHDNGNYLCFSHGDDEYVLGRQERFLSREHVSDPDLTCVCESTHPDHGPCHACEMGLLADA